MDKPIDIGELFRSAADIEDFVNACGEDVPSSPTAARARALGLAESLGPTGAVGTLFTFARAFARMVSEVVEFCRQYGASLGGQIQLAQDNLLFNLSSLETGWAFDGAPVDSSELEARADIVAAGLADLAARLEPEDLITRGTDKEVTAFGHELRKSGVPIWRHYVRRRAYARCSNADRLAIRLAIDVTENTNGSLRAIPMSAGTTAALQDVHARLRAVLAELEAQEISANQEGAPWVASLADELQLLTGQLRQLGEEISQGQRVRRGFHDFLRTEFWPARWRIYELWLLIRVLRTIEQTGGVITLAGMTVDVWAVAYGRAQRPVATAMFPAGKLDVYYQYWREGEDGADMPDLVVSEHGGRPIAVIDPKHGLSYGRSKVQGVLTRYARHLDADLTAVVNYFPVRSYPFEHVTGATRSWILASDVAPDSNHARRLELHLEEALRSRGFHAQAPQALVAAGSAPVAKRRARSGADLVFWAAAAREVDEPAGLWCARAEGDIVQATRLAPGAEGLHSLRTTILEATRDGKSCVLVAERQALVTGEGSAAKPFLDMKDSLGHVTVAWDPAGERFLFCDSTIDRLIDRRGKLCDLPCPAGARVVGWHPDGLGLLCALERAKHEYWLLLVDAKGRTMWESRIPVKAGPYDRFDPRNGWIGRRFGHRDLSVGLGQLGLYDIASDGQMTPSTEPQWPLTVSPSGRYAVYRGPRSHRHDEEGRVLLDIRDGQGNQQNPLVRYVGNFPGECRWSPDETRFAFIPERENPRRLLSARIGERHARAVSLPGQDPAAFAWVQPGLWS